MKIKDKGKIRRILLITLSNVGDIVLSTPVLAVLKKEFPAAAIDVMAATPGKEIFSDNPHVSSFVVFEKHAPVRSILRLIGFLRKNRYDLIVDLRSSLLPLLIGSRYRTPRPEAAALPRTFRPRSQALPGTIHMKQRHLMKLAGLGLDINDAPFLFYISDTDKGAVENLLKTYAAASGLVVISPGAKSHIKRWTKEGFARLCDRLIEELELIPVMVGDEQDKKIIAEIMAFMKKKDKVLDLSAKLTLRQLGALMERARLVITNDSAPLHIASAVGARVLAIFGPTDPKKYGPLGKFDKVIKKMLDCSPCEVAQCGKDHECMNLIGADEVFEAAKRMLSTT